MKAIQQLPAADKQFLQLSIQQLQQRSLGDDSELLEFCKNNRITAFSEDHYFSTPTTQVLDLSNKGLLYVQLYQAELVKEINLSFNPNVYVSNNYFQPSFTVINLEGTYIQQMHKQRMNIVELNVSNCKDFRLLAGQVNYIKKLVARNCQTSFLSLAATPNLKYLDISNNSLILEGQGYLPKSIEVVIAEGNSCKLFDFANCESVKKIVVSHNKGVVLKNLKVRCLELFEACGDSCNELYLSDVKKVEYLNMCGTKCQVIEFPGRTEKANFKNSSYEKDELLECGVKYPICDGSNQVSASDTSDIIVPEEYLATMI